MKTHFEEEEEEQRCAIAETKGDPERTKRLLDSFQKQPEAWALPKGLPFDLPPEKNLSFRLDSPTVYKIKTAMHYFRIPNMSKFIRLALAGFLERCEDRIKKDAEKQAEHRASSL